MRRQALFCLLGFCIPAASHAATWRVPSQCATVRAGIDSASAGDTVLVSCGTYYEYDIAMKSGVRLQSETLSPDCVRIDAQYQGRVFVCENIDTTAYVVGVTITGGSHELGGGMWCASSTLKMFDCLFTQNQAYHGGGMVCWDGAPALTRCTFSQNSGFFGPGGLYCEGSKATLSECVFVNNGEGGVFCSSSSPVFSRCVFSRNWSWEPGGALTLSDSSPRLVNCTFSQNDAVLGGSALYLTSGSSPVLENTILAFGVHGEAVLCGDETSSPHLTCCDVFGNVDGDWVGCIAQQYGLEGNTCLDPVFCNLEDGDLRIDRESPCAVGNHPSQLCGLVGALDVGCDQSSVERGSWSSIKKTFRQVPLDSMQR